MITKQKKQELLGDRVLLSLNVSSGFEQNIEERFKHGIDVMKLENSVIELVFCSSINKQTCLEKLSNDSNTNYLIFDEHHFYVLSSLNLLFYLYGNHDFEFNLMFTSLDVATTSAKRRMNWITKLICAEKMILSSKVCNAYVLLSELQKDMSVLENPFKWNNSFDLNYYLLKYGRAEKTYGYIMSYYVFHELAHIKVDYGAEDLNELYELAQSQINLFDNIKNKYTPDYSISHELPIKDIICDVYAIRELFVLAKNSLNDYDFESIIEAYTLAILNLTLINSIEDNEIGFEIWNKGFWWRVFIVLEILCIINHSNREYCDGIRISRGFVKNKYKKYCNLIDEATTDIFDRYSENRETSIPFSDNWKKDMNSALEIIKSFM